MENHKQTFSILFVCLGNICRSPTAEAIFRKKVQDCNLEEQFRIESAGTSSYHQGELADSRSQQAGLTSGYDLSNIRSQQVTAKDFETFDLILAMDKQNFKALEDMCPLEYRYKIKLFLRDYTQSHSVDEVPDPYYGGENGFFDVISLIEKAADGLLMQLQKQGA